MSGLWGNRILPRVVDRSLDPKRTGDLRTRACAELAGEVLELGFGSGLNVPFYPAAVTGVAAVEPSDLAWQLAAPRVRVATVPVRRSGVDGQRVPLPDASADSALSTWTLCTIPDPGAALAEVRRVLRPGGALHFVEHGLAPDESVRRWQHRLEPVQKRVFGGCHLTRPVAGMLAEAGFTVLRSTEFYEHGTPRPFGALTLGVAVPA